MPNPTTDVREADMSRTEFTSGHKKSRIGFRFARDKRGIAAVEFGLITPVLFIMLIGVFEVTRAVAMDRRFGAVTAMVADLLAREERVDAATVQGIYGIVEHVMGVWGTETMKLHIVPVRAASDDRNDVYVYAEQANRPSYGTADASPRAMCDRYPGLTPDLLEEDGMAIIVEGEFQYAPVVAAGFVTPTTWYDRALLAPRTGCVSFEDAATEPAPDCLPPVSCEGG
jgi:Flp pilus assembly protein TadG